jgi:hypothetical protein
MMFGPSSRYFGLEAVKRTLPNGDEVVFVRRRIVPPPERFALLHDHVVGHGERLDHIAFERLGDAEMFWRLCDANRALRPEELTEAAGRRLRITLPEGIPGPSNG